LTPFLRKNHPANGHVIEEREGSWAVTLLAKPGSLKARLKALRLAGYILNTVDNQITKVGKL
jgi:hypothetical protein